MDNNIYTHTHTHKSIIHFMYTYVYMETSTTNRRGGGGGLRCTRRPIIGFTSVSLGFSLFGFFGGFGASYISLLLCFEGRLEEPLFSLPDKSC